MKVLLFGATGMVGSGVLIECLEDPDVDSVLAVGRAPGRVSHPKLREAIRSDFFDYTDARRDFAGYDACFFCLGVSSAKMPEPEYHHLTYDLTISAAETLAEVNPGMTFCYVSGQGTDSTEHGRFTWARVKGKTENQLLRMPLAAFMFRPGFIEPRKGVRSRNFQVVYSLLRPIYPALRRLFPAYVTTTENIGKAMIRVARVGSPTRILENPDINRLATSV